MNNFLTPLNIIFIGIILFLIIILFLREMKIKKLSSNIPLMEPITPDSKRQDLSMIFENIDKYILKALHRILTKDTYFDEKSQIKQNLMGHYRDSISNLLRPDVIAKYDENGQKVTFFEVFTHNIYMNYIAETSTNIKNLFYKYYSGYNIGSYFNKKRGEPSILPFITEYVRNYLWCRFEEINKAEQNLLDEIKRQDVATDNFVNIMKEYDAYYCQKISSDIYHINDLNYRNTIENSVELGEINVQSMEKDFKHDFSDKNNIKENE